VKTLLIFLCGEFFMRKTSPFLFYGSLLLMASACSFKSPHLAEAGDKTEERSLPSFHKVAVTGNFLVYIDAQHKEQNVSVKASESHLKEIYTSVRDGTLYIEWNLPMGIFKKTSDIPEVSLYVDEIDDIFVHGAAQVYASDIDNAANTNLTLEGAGMLYVDGYTNHLTAYLDGSGTLNATEIPAESVDAELHGSGTLNVTVDGDIRAKLRGSGVINIFGTPENIQKDIEGAGSINTMTKLSKDVGP
jgi:hypothetical protein